MKKSYVGYLCKIKHIPKDKNAIELFTKKQIKEGDKGMIIQEPWRKTFLVDVFDSSGVSKGYCECTKDEIQILKKPKFRRIKRKMNILKELYPGLKLQ